MNNISDIFFDLDHTLWDFDKNSALAFEAIFNKHKLEVSLIEFIKVYVPINQKYWKLYRDEEITKENLRFKRFADAFSALNYAVEEKIINQLSDDYISYLPTNNYLFEGAEKILDYLSKKYRLHIITNGFEEVQHLKLKQSNIAQYFVTVTTSDEVGVKKPNPKIFMYALEKAKAKKEKSLMIGDCLEADVYGAEQVGMKAIYFNSLALNTTFTGTNIDTLIKLQNIL